MVMAIYAHGAMCCLLVVNLFSFFHPKLILIGVVKYDLLHHAKTAFDHS